MAQIELTLPDSLLRKAQDFMPEALAELRNICDALEIGADISAILEKDLTAFLYGKRSEDKADIDRIAELLNDGKVIAHIQNSRKYYVIELFRHYCDVAMRWEVFGEMFPMETTNGRTFFRDYCAVAIQYLNATKAELMAIDTGSIQFEQTGRQFTSYKLADLHSLIVEDADAEPVPVQQGTFAPLTKEAYIKAAGDKVKEWRKCITAGKPDTELSKAQDYIAICRSFADTFAVTPLMMNDEAQGEFLFKKALLNYNATQRVPVSESYAYRTIMGLFINLPALNLRPTRESGDFGIYDSTIGELYRVLYNTAQSPDDATLNGFISSLRFWSQWRPVINGVGTIKSRGGKIRLIPMKKDIRVIDFPELPAQVKDGKRISASTSITMYVHRALSDGMAGQMQSIELNGKTTQIPMKDSKYILPSGSLDSSHNTAEWDRFVLQMKRASHKNEAELMDAVFDYTNRITLIRQDKSLTEEAQQKAIRRMQKDKPRDKKTLTTFFDEAKQRGIITGFRQQAMKKNGKPKYIWRAVESVTE